MLPCAAVSCLGLISIISNGLLLVETHPNLAGPGVWQRNLLRLVMRKQDFAPKCNAGMYPSILKQCMDLQSSFDLKYGLCALVGITELGRLFCRGRVALQRLLNP